MNRFTVVSATDLRTRTRDIVERARFSGEFFIVQRHGRPMAVLLGMQEFENLAGLSLTQYSLSPDPAPVSFRST